MLREGFANNAVRGGWWWWWAPPGICVALLGTGLALVNFGIDEFINPKLRTWRLTARAARRAGVHDSTTLGLTPVMRRAELAAATKQSAADAALEIRGFFDDYGVGDEQVHTVRH